MRQMAEQDSAETEMRIKRYGSVRIGGSVI